MRTSPLSRFTRLLVASLSAASLASPSLAQSDDCATATPISGTGSFPFSTIGMTDSFQFSSCNDLANPVSADGWFSWTPLVTGNYAFAVCGADYDVVLSIRDACGGVELVCDDGFAAGFGACAATANDVTVWLAATAGVPLLIQLDGWGAAIPQTGTGVLEIQSYVPPANEDCTSAVPLSGSGSFPFDSFGAAPSVVPSCNGSNASGDVWFEWTPSGSNDYAFQVCGSTFDVILAVYDSCGGVELGCDDGGATAFGCAGSNFDAEVFLPGLIGGQTYFIQIDGWNGAGGLATLDIQPYSPPPNDDCANATPISGTGSTLFDSTSATSGSIASCNTPGISADIWFEWTAASSGTHEFEICGATHDVVLSVWDGCGGAELACAESNGCGTTNLEDVTTQVAGITAGSTYLVQIDGWNGATGSGALDISTVGPATIGSAYCTAASNSVDPGGAQISATGSTSVAAQDVTLSAAPAPNQPGIFYYGPNQVQIPFGNGFRCVGGTVFRLPVAFASSNTLSHVVDFGVVPASGIGGGDTWNFQAWYRDPAAGGSGFNLSNGLEIGFTP